MATANLEGLDAAAAAADDDEYQPSLLDRPQISSRRKSSFSDALTKITANPFTRRRTTTLPSNSISSTAPNHPSRIPTPSGIPRSTSFFSSLSAFTSKANTTSPSENENGSSERAPLVRHTHKISERLSQTPFFSFQHQRINTTPVTNKQKRESSVQIEQRGLMAPLHPPMPRSSTMGNLGRGQNVQSSPRTPGFMRSTSSSARRSSLNTPKQPNTPMPTISSGKVSTNARRTPSNGYNAPSKTPTNQYRQPSKAQTESDQFPKSELPKLCGRSKGSNALRRSSSFANPARKNTSLPAPVKSILKSSQSKTNGKQHAEYGDEDSSELAELRIQDDTADTTIIHGTALASIHEDSHANAAAPGSDNEEAYPNLAIPLLEGYHETSPGSGECRTPSRSNAAPTSERGLLPALQPAEIDTSDPNLVHTYLELMEWAGRWMSFNDRLRTAALNNPSSNIQNEPMHDDVLRQHRVFIELGSLCATDAARESLAAFKLFMEEKEAKRLAGPVKGVKVKEKHGFFSTLIGKKR